MKLHFQKSGEGPPVILLHGLLGSLQNWQHTARQLSKDFTVLALDLRNHGRSSHADEFSYPALTGDLLEFLADQQFELASLVGHSLGGKVAMHFALLHPARVTKLVVVDIAPKAYPPRHENTLASLLALDLAGARTREDLDAMLAPSVADRGLRQYLLKNAQRNELGGFRWRANLPALHANYEQLREAMPRNHPANTPALFIRGGRSRYVLDEDCAQLTRWFSRAEVQTIADAGHWVPTDAPEEFVETVRAFLKRA